MKAQVPWLRVFVEGVVIVGSILLAFWIEAWWSDSQERVAEAEYLTAIQNEIEENLSAVAANMRVTEIGYQALQRAEDLLVGGGYADSASVFVLSLVRGSGSGGPRISSAVFDELTSSGRIVVIEDLAIRRRVLRVYAQVDVNLERSARTRDEIDANLYSLIAGHLPSGLIQRSGPSISLDQSSVSAEELRAVAASIASEESLVSAIRSEIQERENQFSYRLTIQDRLETARDELAEHLDSKAWR